MQHKYNAELGRVYAGVKVPFKWKCDHPEGFIWYSNSLTSEQGYVCRSGCGQRCDFNPDYFLFQGNVKPLDAPNPSNTKTITFAEEGLKLEGKNRG